MEQTKSIDQNTATEEQHAREQITQDEGLDKNNREENLYTPFKKLFSAANPLTGLINLTMQYNKKMVGDAFDNIDNPSKAYGQIFHDLRDSVKTFYDSGQSKTFPNQLLQQQFDLLQSQVTLCQNTMLKLLGEETEPVISPAKGDNRFQDKDWQENPIFDFIKQSYLLTSGAILNSIRTNNSLNDDDRHKLEYFARQAISAASPTNYPLTNPEVIRKTIETKGENLVTGMETLLEDLKNSADMLNVRMTDLTAFQLGKNIAATPGKVVFQNRLMQLIQYNPSTEKVYQRPLLIIPPWVNKYYILDLSEDKSFIKWAVDQGHTVFIISWINPDASLKDVGFGDYMLEGPLAALDAIEKATGEKKVNTIGYCIGGILQSCLLSYMAQNNDDRIESATYFTTGMNFSDPGDIKVFINEKTISALEKQMETTGYFDGRLMAVSFNLLRENELYWNYYIQNYLKGESPPPYDILFWNSDGTHLPAATHSYFLRHVYLKNKLMNPRPDGLHLKGKDIDIRDIKVPIHFVATDKDHIAKWKTCYAGTKLHSGPMNFTLGGSGHIAGIINPPNAEKYNYWTNDKFPDDPEEWKATAESHPGSWWSSWEKWLQQYSGKKQKARQPGDGELSAIEDAPGSYVKKRISPILG